MRPWQNRSGRPLARRSDNFVSVVSSWVFPFSLVFQGGEQHFIAWLKTQLAKAVEQILQRNHRRQTVVTRLFCRRAFGIFVTCEILRCVGARLACKRET